MATTTGLHDTGVESDLGWALGRIFRSYVKAFDAVFDNVPGGPRGYQVLATTSRGTPRSQLALAQHLGVDRTVMTYLIDDLVEAGLVTRRPDPTDRRARRIAVTEHGHELLHTLEHHLCDAEEHLLAPLDESERQHLRSLLRRVAEHVQHHDPVHNTCDAVDDVRAPGI